jgi:hypothetical protein
LIVGDSGGLYPVLHGLDTVRARILRFAARLDILRGLFRDRDRRHAVVFGIALVLELALAIRWPVPVLVVGPVLFGGMHLVASLRHGMSDRPSVFFVDSANRGRAFATVLLTAGVAVWYALGAGTAGPWPVLLGSATAAYLWREPLGVTGRWGIGTALVGFAVLGRLAPLGLLAGMTLFHHFVAFFHWRRAAKRASERRRIDWAFAAFVVVHAAIFAGLFDAWIGGSEWGGVPAPLLESIFVPWTRSPELIARCLVAFAFGQGMHYVLWLKLIPEQQHSAEVPAGFRQSWRLLGEDFGTRGRRFALLVVIGCFGAALFSSSVEFRYLYFSLSALHGYLEIVALFFARKVA